MVIILWYVWMGKGCCGMYFMSLNGMFVFVLGSLMVISSSWWVIDRLKGKVLNFCWLLSLMFYEKVNRLNYKDIYNDKSRKIYKILNYRISPCHRKSNVIWCSWIEAAQSSNKQSLLNLHQFTRLVNVESNEWPS